MYVSRHVIAIIIISFNYVIGAQVEVRNGYGLEECHTRPADVLAASWMLGKPAAFDFAVTSSLIYL